MFKPSILLPFLALLLAYTLFGPEQQQLMRQRVESQDFSKANPNCLEWTNSCLVCQRDGDKVHCSIAGIACQPKEMVCSRTQ